jgi:hypothetical protein
MFLPKNVHIINPLFLISNATMFPLFFTSFNGSKSIIARIWNPLKNSIDNVFDLAINDPITFLSLTENSPPFAFLGLVASSGSCCSNQKTLAHVMINFASFTSLADPTHVLIHLTSYACPIGPTFILVCLASFADLVSHVRDHIHDHEVISSDNVVELFDF